MAELDETSGVHEGITTQQIIFVSAAAGVISALLPSVPTIVRFWEDETEVTILGQKMRYCDFLKRWVVLSSLGLLVMWSWIKR